MTDNRSNWDEIDHTSRMGILRESSFDQILEDYRFGDKPNSEFRKLLVEERTLWNPQNVQTFLTAGKPPTKDVVLGAWRDLSRVEALLELIDNSLDEWLRRRSLHPDENAKELHIYVRIDESNNLLIYEDNSGGVSQDHLEDLVVPGYSRTTALSPTIGSYKTGGKKAVFRLADAAEITTRYWNPAGTSDDAISIHLDSAWMAEPETYEFHYAFLTDKSVIERGQTRYVFRLREEPIGGPPWYSSPKHIEKIVHDVRQTYSLLMTRCPEIKIYIKDLATPLAPLDELYDFSGAKTAQLDIQPQRIFFDTTLEHEGKREKVEIEIVLGCRTSSSAKPDGQSWGIDLYGNDRLFVAYDQTTFASMLPAGNSKTLVRGYVNIRGPNAFIPWDTHKRHLNEDRDIIQILRSHKLIHAFFDQWTTAYQAISRGAVKALINKPLKKVFDRTKRDISVAFSDRIQLDATKPTARSLSLGSIHVPVVPSPKRAKDLIVLKLNLSKAEARWLASRYSITGDLNAASTTGKIAENVKAEVLKKFKA